MGRYRGKREAARPGQGEDRILREMLEDPFQNDLPLENPFAGEKPPKPDFSTHMRRFWESGKGKILLAVICCAGIMAVAIVVALRMWVRPPTLPSTEKDPAQAGPISTPDGEKEGPTGPTDDELYPDDGYGGDRPTVSGNRKDGVYTFLLVGTDMDDGNTDTIMVASYDTVNQDVSIMSIPRDTMINESWDIKKINSIYSRYSDGMGALKKRIQSLVGFAPDFYIKIDLGMFVQLVDLIGGVEFDVPQDMNYDDPAQNLHIHLKQGVQVLDGENAMGLVRFRRYSEGDIKRVEVQQAFMKALIKECLSLKHWGKVKAYIDLAMENVQTDLEFGSVVWFAANVLGLNGTSALNMDSVYTCTLPGDYWGTAWSRDTHQEQSYVTIYPKQVVELVNERFNPYEQRVTTAMLDAMSIQPNGDIASSTGSLRDSRHNAIMAVRRGEAYYDDDGNLVYGAPPEEEEGPEQDEDGNYFILDEDGNIIYTDENGEPLEEDEPELPWVPGTTDRPFAEDPNAGEDDGIADEPGGDVPENSGNSGEQNGGAGGEGENFEDTGNSGEDAEPEMPDAPPAGLPDEPEMPDSEALDWLFPQDSESN